MEKKYRIGVELIDNQHKELFNNLKEFIELVQKKEIPWDDRLDKAKKTLGFLQDYVIFHFNDEERYQESINYPGLEVHKEVHRDFRESIFEFAKVLEEGGFTE